LLKNRYELSFQSNNINLNLSFYYRYIDIIMAASSDYSTNILNIQFNSFHNRSQFTMEIYYEIYYENNRNISFLDLSLNVIDNNIKIDLVP